MLAALTEPRVVGTSGPCSGTYVPVTTHDCVEWYSNVREDRRVLWIRSDSSRSRVGAGWRAGFNLVVQGLESGDVDLGKGGKRLDGVPQTSRGTLARMANVACCSHSPASGPRRRRR